MNLRIFSWCLYDLANTIFAMNMTSYHFPVWVVSDRKAPELVYSIAIGGSMLAASLCMPWIGRRADRKGSHLPGLIGWTLGCVLLTGSLSFVSPMIPVLALFALANFSYQLAGVFYNALLPSVASKEQRGSVSGAGVALGYGGTLIGLLATAPIAARWGRQSTFLPTALLFLLLSLPCFFWVKEQPPPGVDPPRQGIPAPPLAALLLACFWGLNAVSAVILFMAVYAKQAIGFDDKTLQLFFLTTGTAALLGAFFWGWLTDRIGGYRALGWVWGIWAAVLGLAAVSLNPLLFWGLGCAAAVALSGTWVASRVLILDWVEPARVGEAFGWFGLVSRLSAILGPLVWGAIVWAAAPLGLFRYRLAMMALLGFLLLGWGRYRRLSGSVESGRMKERWR